MRVTPKISDSPAPTREQRGRRRQPVERLEEEAVERHAQTSCPRAGSRRRAGQARAGRASGQLARDLDRARRNAPLPADDAPSALVALRRSVQFIASRRAQLLHLVGGWQHLAPSTYLKSTIMPLPSFAFLPT